MNNFKQVKEEYKEKFKSDEEGYIALETGSEGFGSYTECMTRALFTGLSSFALSFSALYFSQVLLKSYLPYPRKHFLIAPAFVSTAVAWTITSRKTQVCQDTWINTEPYYTEYENK